MVGRLAAGILDVMTASGTINVDDGRAGIGIGLHARNAFDPRDRAALQPAKRTGRALVGTTNMSTSGLRYNEDHVLTFDTRRASATYVESMRRLYSDYMTGWYEMSRDSGSC